MTADNLESLKPAQLGETFAVEAGGYVLYTGKGTPPYSEAKTAEPWCYRDLTGSFYIGEPFSLSHHHAPMTWGYMWLRPKFATSADAVLPHYANLRYKIFSNAVECTVIIEPFGVPMVMARGTPDQLPRLLCTAAIRAARAQKASGS